MYYQAKQKKPANVNISSEHTSPMFYKWLPQTHMSIILGLTQIPITLTASSFWRSF